MRAAELLARCVTLALVGAALGGCGELMGEDRSGLDVAVTNQTQGRLTLSIRGYFEGYVERGATTRVERLAGDDACLDGGVVATTDDGSLVAEMPAPICDGDSWVIADDSLHPAHP